MRTLLRLPLTLTLAFAHQFDTWRKSPKIDAHPKADGIDWVRVVPFLGVHVACIAVIWVGVSPVAVAVAAGLYVLRMFSVTGFYHRYFSHRTFKLGRVSQFVFAVLGASCVQRGPLWWAAHHRHHHKYSDEESDPHSPISKSFFTSHMGWVMNRRNFKTRLEYVPDLAKYPELVFLDRYDILVPFLLGAATFGLGALLEVVAPGLGTNGWQMLVWGFFISTVVLFHATSTINSLSHLIGTRPYATRDRSRNNAVLALLTFGEGWHNNHHHFQGSARQGFRWYQVDLTYYGLVVLSWLGIVRDLKPVPERVLRERR